MMLTISTKDKSCMVLLLRSFSLCEMARWIPMDLYTWILGNRFVARIVMRKIGRAKKMPVRIDRRYDQKHGHPGIQESAQPVIIRFVVKCHVDDAEGNIGKPQKIRYNKILAERDVVIQRNVNDMKPCGYGFFHISKPDQIDWKIQKQQQVFVFFI